MTPERIAELRRLAEAYEARPNHTQPWLDFATAAVDTIPELLDELEALTIRVAFKAGDAAVERERADSLAAQVVMLRETLEAHRREQRLAGARGMSIKEHYASDEPSDVTCDGWMLGGLSNGLPLWRCIGCGVYRGAHVFQTAYCTGQATTEQRLVAAFNEAMEREDTPLESKPPPPDPPDHPMHTQL